MNAPCRIVHDMREAAQMLAAGKVVAFPMETVADVPPCHLPWQAVRDRLYRAAG